MAYAVVAVTAGKNYLPFPGVDTASAKNELRIFKSQLSLISVLCHFYLGLIFTAKPTQVEVES